MKFAGAHYYQFHGGYDRVTLVSVDGRLIKYKMAGTERTYTRTTS